jgi:hypothetical protein
MCVFDFLLWSKNFTGSLKKEKEVSRLFLLRLFNWPRWDLGNPSQFAFFYTHAAAMTSPKSVELKLGVKEPLAEEGKRCELKIPMEIKRSSRIRCGGRVPTGAIAFRYPRQGREGLYSHSKVGALPRDKEEGLQGGVARA